MKLYLVFIILLFPVVAIAQDALHELVRPDIESIRKKMEAQRERERIVLEKERAKQKNFEAERQLLLEQEALMKAEPLVDPNTVKLPEDYNGELTFTVKSGSTLGVASAERYGSPAYASLIATYNGTDPRKLQVGQILKTPSIAAMVRETGEGRFLARYPNEGTSLVKLQYEYSKFIDALTADAEDQKIEEETREKLVAFQKQVNKARKGLLRKKAGVQKYASSTLSQLSSLEKQFSAMLKEDFGKKLSRIERVNVHLGYAMAYSCQWGKDRFQ